LNRYVGDLLDMTRLEGGALNIGATGPMCATC
jgi:K+-sensing histidine kinase KdpD